MTTPGISMFRAKLYSIIGDFCDPNADFDFNRNRIGKIPAVFSGHFSVDSYENIIDSFLQDLWGNSVMEIGSFNEESLDFQKVYTGREKDPINYQFEKKGDLWVGSFKGNEGVGSGICQCKISLYASAEKKEFLRYITGPQGAHCWEELGDNRIKKFD